MRDAAEPTSMVFPEIWKKGWLAAYPAVGEPPISRSIHRRITSTT
jgi:hypothetical protein